MTKYQKIFVVAGLCVAFATAGVLASPGVQADDVVRTGANNIFTGINQFPSIKIGAQGVGGVTFFNGSIVNATTDDDGNDNPVTFGDAVRIDGKLTRGPDADKPVWIGSGLKIDGDIEGIDVADVSGLQDDLDGKASSSAAYTKSESDGRYYTQTTSDSTFVSKASPSWNAQTSYAVIPGSAFVPQDGGFEDNDINDSSALYLSGSGGASEVFFGAIQLPHGATITNVTLNYNQDNAIAETVSIRLKRTAHSNGSFQYITDGLTSTNDDYGSTTSAPTGFATVDNNLYDYYFHAIFSDDTQGLNLMLVSAEVEYQITSPY
ncbi:hypothetical protein ACFL2B_00425 [Patescibacteria group bacterium]